MDSASASGHLLENLVIFGRLLRTLGVEVGPDRMMDFIRALDAIDFTNRDDFYYAARASLVSRREDLPIFDAAFAAFWRTPSHQSPRRVLNTKMQRPPGHPLLLPPSMQNNHNQRKGDANQPPQDEPPVETIARYSPRAALRHKDFADLTPEEMQEVKDLISSFIWQLGERRTRRLERGGSVDIDMRRTIRHNLGYGGEVLRWAYRQPAYKPRPLVLIADISGSMDRYTRLLLRFCYSMARSLKQPVETFLFSTYLTRITWQFRRRNLDQALTEVGQTVSDWSGGTRIGEALRTFNVEWGQRVLGRGAIVILISDGWDRGDVDLLHREMARLKRTSYRLIWLNPLLGSPDYEPSARGMMAALPHIDDFLPVHNLASLEALADHLASLGNRSQSWRTYARYHR